MTIEKQFTRRTIAKRAAAIVRERGESLTAFCKHIGVNNETLYCNLDCSSMSTDVLLVLCRELDVTADYLLGLTDEK